ncbi:MAG: GNAT family N-acetyltransferase [Pseudomonadota bacterium]|nr:GNAT family N-acetyltransferase [Pseudomonadota bacterium]
MRLRAAERADVGVVLELIRELARFERLEHLCVATESDLLVALFGEPRRAEVLLACQNDEVLGFALFFHSFSTFLGRPGLWLEDLFVRPQHRRQGCGRALLRALAAIARERGCGRFEWTVLDWNADAIAFYQSLGALLLPDWRIVRVTGPALAALADPASQTSTP